MIELLNILSLTIFLTVCVTGILLLLVLTERNRLQKTLAVILGIFAILTLGGLINALHSYSIGVSTTESPLSFRYLVMGFIAFSITVRYYIVAAHRRLHTTRNSLLLFFPIFVILTIYIVWHLGAGVPMNYKYSSLQEVWQKRYSVPVMLRMMIYLFFLIYEIVIFVDMWRMDAGRGKYSVLNTPDAVSNIRWLRMVVVGIVAITVVYTVILFAPSAYTMLVYVVVTCVVFISFIYNAITRRMYEDTEAWQVTWSVRGGWKAIGETAQQQPQPSEEVETTGVTLAQIEDWMRDEKPYCSTEFSINDLMAHFASVDRATLTALLKPRADSISSYIRQLRVEHACKIIRKSEEIKILELAPLVGFSHSTSFSRAFRIVMGETVLQYMSRVGAKRKPNTKLSNINNTSKI